MRSRGFINLNIEPLRQEDQDRLLWATQKFVKHLKDEGFSVERHEIEFETYHFETKTENAE